LTLQGRQLSQDELAQLQNTVRANFASTETRLSAAGIERKTHSAFGQFSTFLSLLHQSGSSAASLLQQSGSSATPGKGGSMHMLVSCGSSDSVARRQ
jgi:hypothetical protein